MMMSYIPLLYIFNICTAYKASYIMVYLYFNFNVSRSIPNVARNWNLSNYTYILQVNPISQGNILYTRKKSISLLDLPYGLGDIAGWKKGII